MLISVAPGLPDVYQVYPRNPLILNRFRGFFFAPFLGSVYHGSTRETFLGRNQPVSPIFFWFPNVFPL